MRRPPPPIMPGATAGASALSRRNQTGCTGTVASRTEAQPVVGASDLSAGEREDAVAQRRRVITWQRRLEHLGHAPVVGDDVEHSLVDGRVAEVLTGRMRDIGGVDRRLAERLLDDDRARV